MNLRAGAILLACLAGALAPSTAGAQAAATETATIVPVSSHKTDYNPTSSRPQKPSASHSAP